MLLKKNAVFCAQEINMLASRTSADKAALLEQFTGRKIDAKIDLRIANGDYVQAINPLKDNQVENANTHGCMFSNRFIIAICSARISNIFFPFVSQ
jgi:hypothetical protein